MNPTSESFDQPTQVGKTGGKKLTRQQKTRIYAGLGGAAALAGGSALAWGMSQDGNANDNHPKTESKPASEPKPASETPADSTHVTVDPHARTTPATETIHSKPETNDSTNTHEPMIATHITDEMSFDDAFKTARQEVGPGGYFEWNGHFYNTYYKQEWDAMSTHEREEYAATVYGDETPGTDQNSSHLSTVGYDANKPDIKVGEYQGRLVAFGDADHDGDAEVIVVDGKIGVVDKDNDGIMETRVQLDPTTHEVIAQAPLTTTFDAPKMSELATSGSYSGNPTTDNQMEVHVVNFQGHNVIMGDSDHDGDAEVLIIDGKAGVVDTDNDGVMETQVQLDPTTHEVIAHSPMTEVYNAPKMTAFDAPQNQVTPTTANETNQDIDVIKTTVDGHNVAMADSNHDGYVDVMIADTGIGAADLNNDHQFETAIRVDMNTGEIVASAPLDHTYAVPTTDSFSTPDHTGQPAEIAAHDFDNHADVSDWVA